MKKKSGLGKGLSALIEESKPVQEVFKGVDEIAIDKIVPNPYQPRSIFDEKALEELSLSISQIGLVQPITVRLKEDGESYELISGERRWRASKMAGKTHIPAYVRQTDSQGMLEMAIVENVQRENLDAIEVAISFQQLIDECQLTQEQLADRIGKKRTTVSNYLRLLKLAPAIQIGIRENKITMGHAKALMGVTDSDSQLMLFEQILKYDFSVRKTEEIVQEFKAQENTKSKSSKPKSVSKEYKELEQQLSDFFNTKVKLNINSEGKGKISLPFKSEDELAQLLTIIDRLK